MCTVGITRLNLCDEPISLCFRCCLEQHCREGCCTTRGRAGTPGLLLLLLLLLFSCRGRSVPSSPGADALARPGKERRERSGSIPSGSPLTSPHFPPQALPAGLASSWERSSWERSTDEAQPGGS